nr:unnamed protein product [Callosobruchus chinensis]
MQSLSRTIYIILLPCEKTVYRKYLRFKFENSLYQFNCLPFGLNIAPFIFTKILKPLAKKLRLMGIMIVFYLNDILTIGRDKKECKKHTDIVLSESRKLGFIINIQKGMLDPQQNIRFLGFLYNTITMTISLPCDKCEAVRKTILAFQNKNMCTVREFARLIGRLVASCPATQYGFIHIKPFEEVKHHFLREDYHNYNRKMYIPASLQQELEWWHANICSGQDLKPRYFSVEINSDASRTGWGFLVRDPDAMASGIMRNN